MRVPTTKSLVAAFRDLDTKGANLIRRLAHAADDSVKLAALIERECPATHAYARSCYNDPYNTKIWRVTMALHAIDRILGTHGVETLGEGRRGDYAPPYEYCNAGDTYSTTLIYTRDTDTIRIGCWGDIVERHPEQFRDSASDY
jgi:hypothetical protein